MAEEPEKVSSSSLQQPCDDKKPQVCDLSSKFDCVSDLVVLAPFDSSSSLMFCVFWFGFSDQQYIFPLSLRSGKGLYVNWLTIGFSGCFIFQDPASSSGYRAYPNGDSPMYPVFYPALVPGHYEEQTNRGAGIYAVPLHQSAGHIAGLPSNYLIPLTYNVPT